MSERGGAVVVLAMEAGDEVIDQLRDGGVLADDDEAGRHRDARLLPELEGLLVVAVESFERGLAARVGSLSGSSSSPVPRPFLGMSLRGCVSHRLRNIGISSPGMFSRHRHAGQLHDAALDGIHEREVAHRPREQRALDVAGAAQEEGRGGEIDDARHAELAVHRFQAGNPETRGFVVLLGLFLLVALEVVLVLCTRSGFLPVAVVGLVIDHEDVLHAHQVGHDALDHLAFGLQRLQVVASAALEELASAFGKLDALAQLEGVVVGDDDLGLASRRPACRCGTSSRLA